MSAGIRHAIATSSLPPETTNNHMSIPTSIPSDYNSLHGIPCSALYGRLQILNHFSNCILSSWKLFNSHSTQIRDMDMFHINPLSDGRVRYLISPGLVDGLMSAALVKTMNTKSHGPSVVVHRIAKEYVNS